MTTIIAICTFGVYSFYIIEAIKAYRNGDEDPRPRGRKITLR